MIILPKQKQTGKWRFFVDYRKLNSVAVRDSYPLPRMDDCIDTLHSTKVFLTLDCNSGFWKVQVRDEHRDKRTFSCYSGTYQYKKMPFGLMNSPATLQRAFDIFLSGYRWQACIIYLGNIILFTSSFDEHIKHLGNVPTALGKAGATIRLDKCEFFASAVSYLGHVVLPGLLEIANKNAAIIQEFADRKTQTQFRSFLRICNVDRRFVPNFSKVTSPLNELLMKVKGPSIPALSDEHCKSLDTLKAALANPPVLFCLARISHIHSTPTLRITLSAVRYFRSMKMEYKPILAFGLVLYLPPKKIIAAVNESASLLYGQYKFCDFTSKANITNSTQTTRCFGR